MEHEQSETIAQYVYPYKTILKCKLADKQFTSVVYNNRAKPA